MPATFLTRRRVEFGDTDMAGIMHFANFFKFMEVAETDFLLSLGFSVSWLREEQHFGFPRVSTSCDFMSPARFGDILDIGVTVEKLGTKSITYRFDFTRGTDTIAVGRTTAVFCRKLPTGGMESLAIPTEMRELLSTPHSPPQ